jgi:hypothetical protein
LPEIGVAAFPMGNVGTAIAGCPISIKDQQYYSDGMDKASRMQQHTVEKKIVYFWIPQTDFFSER